MTCYDSTGNTCSGKAQPGARALGNYLVEKFDLPMLGIYNCRPTRTGGSLSSHAEGRGVDAHVHIRCSECDPTPVEARKGWEIVNWLLANADRLGLQRIIWLDKTWVSVRGWKMEPYRGPFHGNHVHTELCWESARTLTYETITEGDDPLAAFTKQDLIDAAHLGAALALSEAGISPDTLPALDRQIKELRRNDREQTALLEEIEAEVPEPTE